MNKLMFAAVAALCATVAVADGAETLSTGIVGYQELATEGSGFTMVAPTFLKVSESNTVTLADLKVTGYIAPTWEKSGKVYVNKNGCGGQTFKLSTLTTQGIEEEAYFWLDYMKSATDRVGPGWFANTDGTPIDGGEGSVELDAGKALWISGSGLALQPTGAVNPFDVEYKTEDSGFVAVGNCMPYEVKLSDLTVTGYIAPTWEKSGKVYVNKNGCGGQTFKLSTLTTQGIEEEAYFWLDYMKSATDRVGPGWFANTDGTEVQGGADSVKIPAGKGLWVSGSGLSLIIPALEL